MKFGDWAVLALATLGMAGCSGDPNPAAFTGPASVTPADAPQTAEEYEAKNGMIPQVKK